MVQSNDIERQLPPLYSSACFQELAPRWSCRSTGLLGLTLFFFQFLSSRQMFVPGNFFRFIHAIISK